MSAETANPAGMSEREAEVLQKLGAHLTNAKIASQMHISVRTVESHVSSLLRKFGVPDRRALAELAPAVAARPLPRSGAGPVVGLSSARTTFIGREQEQAAVREGLAGRDGRVVSLIGPGGVGKTRLAAKMAETMADQYPSGAVFIDLVPVRAGGVTRAVATLLDVTESAHQSLDAALHEHLARGRSLLVFDNCEHLLDEVPGIIEKLLADCEGLTVLATSRERLAIPGERTVTVRPLSLVAGETGNAVGSEATVLFTDRVRASDPEFTTAPEVVGAVCARLDGMPLAIELAAARCASLGVDGLLAGLDDHLRLLSGGRGTQERHRSLRSVIDWSHDLLDEDEQVMFRRAGAFVGGFDLDAAVALCPGSSRGLVADLVGRLTDKSLLTHRGADGGSRWQMLATIRAYALDRLADSGEETTVRVAHLRWAAAIAGDLERRAEAGELWRDAFDTVAGDLRSALAGAPTLGAGGSGPDHGELSHRLARALAHLTYARRFMAEARQHYEAAAAWAAGPAQAAADLRAAADVALAEGRNGVSFELLLGSAEEAEDAGDDSARAIALAWAATIADRFVMGFPQEVPHHRLRELVAEATRACPPGDAIAAAYVAAAAAWTAVAEKTIPDPALARDALAAAQRADDPVLISGALDAMVCVLDQGGRIKEAHQLTQERAKLVDRMPRHDPRTGMEISDLFHMVTAIAVTAGDLPKALSSARTAQSDDVAAVQPYVAASKLILPLVLQGRFDDATGQAASMWETWLRAGRPPAQLMPPAAYGMVLACGLRGDQDGRQKWLERAYELIGHGPELVAGSSLMAAAAFTEARICLHEGRADAALAAVAGLHTEAEDWYGTPHWHALRAYAWAISAEVAVVAGRHDAASRLAAAQPAGDENYWAAACLARAAGLLHNDRDALERALAGWDQIGARFEHACTLMLLSDRADEARAELHALGCQPPAEPA
ncbi:MAG TPA: LuxR C-terminal-related transcriptional regulator [Streptosporangiaceae bacterium]